MSFEAIAVANAFIKRRTASHGSLPDLTPMKIQKLLYFTQGWYIKGKNEMFIADFFARWKYGPVIPSLYCQLRKYGASEVTHYLPYVEWHDDEPRIMAPFIPEVDEYSNSVIDWIIKYYGKMSGGQLSHLSHLPNTPWAINKDENSVISIDEFKQYWEPFVEPKKADDNFC